MILHLRWNRCWCPIGDPSWQSCPSLLDGDILDMAQNWKFIPGIHKISSDIPIEFRNTYPVVHCDKFSETIVLEWTPNIPRCANIISLGSVTPAPLLVFIIFNKSPLKVPELNSSSAKLIPRNKESPNVRLAPSILDKCFTPLWKSVDNSLTDESRRPEKTFYLTRRDPIWIQGSVDSTNSCRTHTVLNQDLCKASIPDSSSDLWYLRRILGGCWWGGCIRERRRGWEKAQGGSDGRSLGLWVWCSDSVLGYPWYDTVDSGQ
jgi:hypothetical protein